MHKKYAVIDGSQKTVTTSSDLNSTTSWKVHYLETTFVFSSVHVFGFLTLADGFSSSFRCGSLLGLGRVV